MRGHSTRAGRRLALILTTAAAVVAAFGATAAPSMALDLRVATTTTLTASAGNIDPSGSVTLTASVRPGLLVGPIGNVKFTDTTNGALLGTVRPRLDCLLKREPCVATITAPGSALSLGDNTIVAAYSGGLFTKPSSGSTDVFVGTSNTCPSGGGTCDTSLTSSDKTTSATITTTPGAQNETVEAFFDNETPSTTLCPVLGQGDMLVYSVTNLSENTKTIKLTLNGAAADAENTLAGKFGNVCFGSTASFTTDSGKPATLNPADGLFYGNLPLCDDNDDDTDFPNESGGHFVVGATAFPCINPVSASDDTWATYTNGSGTTPSTSTYTETFTTTAADPKAHG